MSTPWSNKGAKGTLVLADEFLILDSEDGVASTKNKRITGTVAKTFFQTPLINNVNAAAKDILNSGLITFSNPSSPLSNTAFGFERRDETTFEELRMNVGIVTDKIVLSVAGFDKLTIGDEGGIINALDIQDILELDDFLTDPVSNGQFTRNGADVKVFTGGNVVNLSGIAGPPFSDTPNLIVSATGTSRAFKVDASGAADSTLTVLTVENAAGTNVIALPDATGTIVLEDLIQNLTQKSMDADNNTFTNFALGAEVTGASTDLTDSATLGRLASTQTWTGLNTFTANQNIATDSTGVFTIQSALASPFGSFITMISSRGTIASPQATQGNDGFATIDMRAFDGVNFRTGARLQSAAVGDWNSTPTTGTQFSINVTTSDTQELIPVFTAEGDSTFFNVSFPQGVASPSYISTSGGDATAGLYRLPVDQSIAWRNNAANGNLLLGVDSNNILTWDGKGMELVLDGGAPLLKMSKYGALATPPQVNFMSARGTEATPLYPLLDDFLGSLAYNGYNEGGAAFVASFAMFAFASENWDASSHGTEFQANMILTGTITPEVIMIFDPASGFVRLERGGNVPILDFPEIATPANPIANVARMYSKDNAGTTSLYFRDSAGTERIWATASTDLTDTANIGYLANAQTWSLKQTFTPVLAGESGINIGSIAGNPTTQVNADVWLNSSTNQVLARINGANVDLGANDYEAVIPCQITSGQNGATYTDHTLATAAAEIGGWQLNDGVDSFINFYVRIPPTVKTGTSYTFRVSYMTTNAIIGTARFQFLTRATVAGGNRLMDFAYTAEAVTLVSAPSNTENFGEFQRTMNQGITVDWIADSSIQGKLFRNGVNVGDTGPNLLITKIELLVERNTT